MRCWRLFPCLLAASSILPVRAECLQMASDSAPSAPAVAEPDDCQLLWLASQSYPGCRMSVGHRRQQCVLPAEDWLQARLSRHGVDAVLGAGAR
eukprot:10971523-Alexandrium_andersonii.AAC.1